MVREGSLTTPASKRWNWPAIRATVPGSNRSLLYSNSACSPSEPMSNTSSVRSNLEVPFSASNWEALSPSSVSRPAPAFWNANMTWKTGLWLASRDGASPSTSRS